MKRARPARPVVVRIARIAPTRIAIVPIVRTAGHPAVLRHVEEEKESRRAGSQNRRAVTELKERIRRVNQRLRKRRRLVDVPRLAAVRRAIVTPAATMNATTAWHPKINHAVKHRDSDSI